MCFQSFTLETESFSRRHVLPGTNCTLTNQRCDLKSQSCTWKTFFSGLKKSFSVSSFPTKTKHSVFSHNLNSEEIKDLILDLLNVNLCTLPCWNQNQKFKCLQGERSRFLVKKISLREAVCNTFTLFKGILQAKQKPECAEKSVTTSIQTSWIAV